MKTKEQEEDFGKKMFGLGKAQAVADEIGFLESIGNFNKYVDRKIEERLRKLQEQKDDRGKA